MSAGLQIAQERIEQERQEKTGILDLGRLGLRHLPEDLFELDHLTTLNLGSSAQIKGKQVSASSDITPNRIFDDLEKLQILKSLKALFLNEVRCPNLDFLSNIPQLAVLSCANSDLEDISRILATSGLEYLDLSGNPITEIYSLSSLKRLKSLILSRTPVSDLGPLKDLQSLQSLNLWGTPVSDLGPLKDLQSLQSLNLS